MSHANTEKNQFIEALQWHIDHGVDEAVLDIPFDRTALPEIPKKLDTKGASSTKSDIAINPPTMMGAAEAMMMAQKLAAACQTLEELATAIQNFDGLSIKKTATNMVFADGHPQSDIMLIGDAPGADEDIQGKAFVGQAGKLLDKILASIALSRDFDESKKSVYLSNILNWRPPGNRTPTDSEIAISLIFAERHIALVRPKILILCGAITAKSLLKRNDIFSKLRGRFYDYQTQDGHSIQVMTTYHPEYLLRTPAQKKAVWEDMLMIQDYIENNY